MTELSERHRRNLAGIGAQYVDLLEKGRKGFDPNQPRDPNTGRWIRVFAHGILKDPDTMRSWAKSARYVGTAELPGYSQTYDRGPSDVVRDPGQSVPGVLWDVPEDEVLTQLDMLEGVKPGGHGMYDRREMEVVREDGETDRAHVYEMPKYEIFVNDLKWKGGLDKRQVHEHVEAARRTRDRELRGGDSGNRITTRRDLGTRFHPTRPLLP